MLKCPKFASITDNNSMVQAWLLLKFQSQKLLYFYSNACPFPIGENLRAHLVGGEMVVVVYVYENPNVECCPSKYLSSDKILCIKEKKKYNDEMVKSRNMETC